MICNNLPGACVCKDGSYSAGNGASRVKHAARLRVQGRNDMQ